LQYLKANDPDSYNKYIAKETYIKPEESVKDPLLATINAIVAARGGQTKQKTTETAEGKIIETGPMYDENQLISLAKTLIAGMTGKEKPSLRLPFSSNPDRYDKPVNTQQQMPLATQNVQPTEQITNDYRLLKSKRLTVNDIDWARIAQSYGQDYANQLKQMMSQ
jgi:hypothetical protein